MPWSFIVPAAISLFTSNEQSDAAQQAANTAGAASDRAAELQRQTASEQLALQKRMYEEDITRQQPFYNAGTNALAQMQAQYNKMPAAFEYNQMPAAFQYNKMPAAFEYNEMPDVFTGKVNLGEDPGYAFRLKEGQKALDRQAAARGGLISGGALKAATRYGQEMGSQEYGNAYNRALTRYNAGVNREATGYNRALTRYNADINREATGYNRALTRYNADINREATGYNRALTGYNADINREATGYNRLASMAGIGQTSANTIGAAGQNYATGAGNIAGNMASNVGNIYAQQGVNQGNALIAGTQARASSYGDISERFGKYYGGGGMGGPQNFDPFGLVNF
jgi:hypothetical protein